MNSNSDVCKTVHETPLNEFMRGLLLDAAKGHVIIALPVATALLLKGYVQNPMSGLHLNDEDEVITCMRQTVFDEIRSKVQDER